MLYVILYINTKCYFPKIYMFVKFIQIIYKLPKYYYIAMIIDFTVYVYKADFSNSDAINILAIMIKFQKNIINQINKLINSQMQEKNI